MYIHIIIALCANYLALLGKFLECNLSDDHRYDDMLSEIYSLYFETIYYNIIINIRFMSVFSYLPGSSCVTTSFQGGIF